MARDTDDERSRPPEDCRRAIRVRTLSLLLVLALVNTTLASAESRKQPQGGLQELAGELSGWIALHTSYLEPAPPEILLETQAGLQELCFPGFTHDLLPRIRGAYDARSNTIYLNTDFDTDSVLDLSYLLHELVHHFQTQNLSLPSRRQKPVMEAEALRMQLLWLGENDVTDAMTKLGVDEKTLRMLEASPR